MGRDLQVIAFTRASRLDLLLHVVWRHAADDGEAVEHHRRCANSFTHQDGCPIPAHCQVSQLDPE